MIKKKIKKKRKKCRKNPHVTKDFKLILAEAIYFGAPRLLVDAITIYNQGDTCEDCEQFYHWCECEKCDDCGYNRCICNIDINDPQKISNLALELAKKSLTKSDIVELKININKLLNDYNVSKKDQVKIQNKISKILD